MELILQMFARRKKSRQKLRQTKRLRQLQHILSFANSAKKHIAKYDMAGFAKALKKIHKFIWHHLKQQLDPLQGQLDSPAIFIIIIIIITIIIIIIITMQCVEYLAINLVVPLLKSSSLLPLQSRILQLVEHIQPFPCPSLPNTSRNCCTRLEVEIFCQVIV